MPQMTVSGLKGETIKKAPALGIDLGTTHSCIAYVDDNGTPVVVPMSDRNRTMPSVVAFKRSGTIVGVRAKTDIEVKDSSAVYDSKRLLGRMFADPAVQEMIETWPFDVVPDFSGLPKYKVTVAGKETLYSPEEISSMILSELRRCAERHFGDKVVQDCVITVPAYFNDAQRKATQAAAQIAGLSVLHIINEPTAAALSFGLRNPPIGRSRNVLVFDLGGGTLDVVLLEHSDAELKVINVGGDCHLGGQDFDWHICALALEAWNKQHPDIEIVCGSKAWRRLRLACEAAKRELSTMDIAGIDLADLTGPDQDLWLELSRTRFHFQAEPLFERCMEVMFAVLFEANYETADIDDLVVVGGASRMPWLQQALCKNFPVKTVMHMTDEQVNASEAVALGAAIMAARQAAIAAPPEEKSQHFDPEDMGPAVIDAVPRTLGIQHGGNLKLMKPIVPKGSRLPATGTQQFTTSKDGQTVIIFQVFEGEDRQTDKNHKLGEFSLTNIRPDVAGAASITVTMHVNEAGVLQTTAIDNHSGQSTELVVKAQSRVPDADVALMAAAAQRQRAKEAAAKEAAARDK